MEKQPDKMQVMFEWFLGDAKELADQMQKISGDLAKTAAEIDGATKGISAAVEASKIETIAAQRELAASLKKAASDNAEFAKMLMKSQATFGNELKSRILIYTVGGSLIGGAVGALIVALFTH
ncbi:hypothetical protein [Enterobacter sp.]|jgi:hypothetical protein|uniref:hypothetical protein n=1 Tax=Enterobacter sp. TaxID=42895 RepID=UPI00296E52E4|nr:hypothetical protein [Enterobacter sp.]